MLIISIAVSIISSVFMLPYVFNLCSCRIVNNYRGEPVRNSMGICFVLDILFICSAILVYENFLGFKYYDKDIGVICIGTIAAAFGGIADDTSKDSVKGISGHIKALMEGKLTAGLLKAILGLLSSYIICLILGFTKYNLILNVLILSLCQNFINLLDTRPLRAIKSYMFFLLLSLPYGTYIYITVNLGILSMLPLYAVYERNEQCMMGDAGSNLLGIILGLSIISSRAISFRLVSLIFLCIVQLYAEKKSINSLLESNSILKYLDMLGRCKEFDKNKKRHCRGHINQE